MRRRPVRRRRRKIIPAPEASPKLERQQARYAADARMAVEAVDQMEPYMRALIKYFGPAVIARIPVLVEPREIPKRFGKVKEFAEYWEQFNAPNVARKEAETERIASVWSGLI